MRPRYSDVPSVGRVPIRPTAYQAGRSGRGLSARWIGQDGHDFVSASDRHEPDERMDIHLALTGLDPRREIRFIDITVPGGHRWQYNPLPGYWHAHLRREKGATAGDLWVGPIDMPAGLVCHMLVRYDDDTTAEADVRSRKTSSVVRCASVSVKARWVGQDRQDLTGVGACVGPDGLQDARLHLSGLSPTVRDQVDPGGDIGGSGLGVRPESPAPQQRRVREGCEGSPARRLLLPAGPRPRGPAAPAERRLRGQRAPGWRCGRGRALRREAPDAAGPAPEGRGADPDREVAGAGREQPCATRRCARRSGRPAGLGSNRRHRDERHRARGLAVSRQRSGAGAPRRAAGHARRPVPPRSQDGRPVCLALPRHQSGDLLRRAWSRRTAGPGMASSPAAPAT